jgi:hypothetical protein
MDIEFHYYMTYLIAARAGFSPADAAIVATAAQEVDDNHILIRVSAGTPAAYDSVISQTMNILRPHHAAQVYPIFHFIPGEPDAPSARRKDGRRSPWTTTPNSSLANEMLDTALRSGNLYRIGASTHAYVDTWAHQNFLGREDELNDMPYVEGEGLLQLAERETTIMKIGHALAGHKPDIPDLIWSDGRLVNDTVVNAERFLDAAEHLFRKLDGYKRPGRARPEADRDAASLVADLRADIGPSAAASAPTVARIERYKARALLSAYGSAAIPLYEEGNWANEAFVEQRADLTTRIAVYVAEHAGLVGDALNFGTRMPCTWKDPALCHQTHWFRFQEGVKSHLAECWGVLTTRLPEISS